ncbi:AmmeMemoRadiSam system protein B [Chromatiales bacterium (ex Bugula neritina AB1)]|nr:AmmeMemoRadiSam system protein B [Chromatiales bacterium (ex Bugula neritina AB1)]
MNVRVSANAGAFYPAHATALQVAVRYYSNRCRTSSGLPVAIVAPHAGYGYCGEQIAAAFSGIQGHTVRKVIHIGPSHYFQIAGIVQSGATKFESPFGAVPVHSISHTLVNTNAEAHRPEHALEVHLPFLQYLLAEFVYIPLLVGQCNPEDLADVLQLLEVGSSGVLLVVSSDLSHYLPSAEALNADLKTLHQLERLKSVELPQACGAHALNGAVTLARRNKWGCMAIDRADSSQFDKTRSDKVVGYGAIAFYPAL